MTRPIDTSKLGPIKIDPAAGPDPATVREAFKRWWNGVCRQGDPSRRPNLVEQAFHAGYASGAQTQGIAHSEVNKDRTAAEDRPRCSCGPDVIARVQAGGTCAGGGCPYGGDF